jgi:hypothetical protein
MYRNLLHNLHGTIEVNKKGIKLRESSRSRRILSGKFDLWRGLLCPRQFSKNQRAEMEGLQFRPNLGETINRNKYDRSSGRAD